MIFKSLLLSFLPILQTIESKFQVGNVKEHVLGLDHAGTDEFDRYYNVKGDIKRFTIGPYMPQLFPPTGPNDPPCRLIIFQPQQNGTYPITLFLGGMLGLVPEEWYDDLNHRMSNAGPKSIVITLDLKLSFSKDYFDAARYLQLVLDWVVGGVGRPLDRYLSSGVRADYSNLFIATHSSGAQSGSVVWKNSFKLISGLIFFDPVDAMGGASKKDFYPPPVTDPKHPAKFRLLPQPVLIISSGLCSHASLHLPPPPFLNMSKIIKLPPIFSDTNLWPACCPKDLGPSRFWDTLSPLAHRPVFMWNFTDYGHCDLLDDRWAWTNRFMRLCSSIVDGRLARGEGNVFDLHVVRKSVGAVSGAFMDFVSTRSGSQLKRKAKSFLLANLWNNENVTMSKNIM